MTALPSAPTLRPILGYLKRHLREIAAGVVLLTLCNLFELVQPRIWKGIVDDLAAGSATRRSLLLAALLLVGAGLGRSVFSFLQRLALIGTSRRIEYDIRNDLFRHLQRLPPSYYVVTKTGDLMSRATSDINAVRMLLGLGVMVVFDTINLLGVSVFFMIHTSPTLTAVAMAPLLLLPFLVRRFTGVIHLRYEAVQEHLSRISARVQENMSGIRVVKAFVQEASEVAAFRRLNGEYIRLALREAKVEVPFNPLLSLCAGLGVVLAVVVGGWRVAQGQMSLGDYVAFDWYLTIAVGPMAGFGVILTMWQKGQTSMGRLQEVLTTVPEIADAEGVARPQTIQGAVVLRALTVRYPGAERPALEGVSAEIPAGAFVAVVGPVGAGKTTLLQAIARLVKVPDGQVLVDGIDVNRLALASLRGAIGMVPQDTFLFSDTIRNNIAFGRMDAPDGAAEEAAALSGVDEEIRRFPEAYAQRIGERGVTLSGGQRQRIAIARALARDPRILLLDNCLSSVDAETEDRILKSLRTFLKGRTSIVVSHRVSAIRDADLILVMDEGRVVERGTHAELLAAGGEYAWLCRRQELELELERT